jgi:hypothetical protein
VNFSTETCDADSRQGALAGIGAEMQTLAAGLDLHFVAAGSALARTYEIVEHLVGALEGVTGAMNRKAATSAVQTMQLTADRLTRLPMEQSKRQETLNTITSASSDLLQNLKQIRRTLSFLQICGLNIKVVAAGAEGFANFADHMFVKLEQAEQQVDEFEAEIAQLEDNIREMVEADRLLISECVTVIPRVPLQLAQDAQALQKLQDDSAALAEDTAKLARDVRSKVGVAIGALQVGDITRQRLEHITQGILLLQGHIDGLIAAEADGDEAAEATQAAHRAVEHVITLMAAQATDTVEQFLRETGILYSSLRGIVPDAARLADMQHGGGSGDIQQVLNQLEKNVGEIAKVTRQLCSAEANSGKLGQATSHAADSLRGRLKAVNRIQRDVEQMAWNTALQCRDLGADGRGIAVISEEIQSFSRHLADIWELVAHNFGQVVSSASTVGQAQSEDAEPDTTDMLVESLETIKSGNDRMTESLQAVDQDALQVGGMLRALTDDLTCETHLGPAMIHAAEALKGLAAVRDMAPATTNPATDQERQAITALFDRIAALYTMASERDVHRAFVSGCADVKQVEAAPASSDDGLFDDDLFDDGLF